ncbi:hypothetical protein [Bacillus sp. EAC]|uniref:hypothetical protein n=1 Tax=Bacillus sp. EAC TaxID=1978338 RepID=UPI000B432D84|nr:hypothetical protein [Bacillus sp. EAC]
MIESLIRIFLAVIREIVGFILEVIFELFLSSLFEKIFYGPYHKKNEELIMGRIFVLQREPWFEQYKIYTSEIANRKSIRKLIVKMNMTDVLTNEVKRNDFLTELNNQLFDLNRKPIRIKKTSHM